VADVDGGRLRRGVAATGRRVASVGRRGSAATGWRLIALAAAAALVLGGALVLMPGGSGRSVAAGSSTAGGATGTVERRTLAERLTATGAIGYAGERTVLARLAGTVTALPAIGDVIRRGGELFGLGGEPVLLMYGKVPAYRDLSEGVAEGPDVEQLERNLKALGYGPGIVDEAFTATTAAAVVAWQEDLGLEPTGVVELGRVAFLPGPQRVTAAEATLGEALGGGGGGGEAGSEPASVPALRTSSTRRVVRVQLEADQGSVAHRGQRVEVVLPGGVEAPGEVRGLAAVELSGGGAEPGEVAEPGVETTVSMAGKQRIPALDGATVNVRFTQRVRRHVLSVPLTALLAIGGDRFAVTVRDGAASRRIVVSPGLAADGYVEVAGDGLRPGMRVETGE
jgi:membrane fusion protein, multidrug efflux system